MTKKLWTTIVEELETAAFWYAHSDQLWNRTDSPHLWRDRSQQHAVLLALETVVEAMPPKRRQDALEARNAALARGRAAADAEFAKIRARNAA